MALSLAKIGLKASRAVLAQARALNSLGPFGV